MVDRVGAEFHALGLHLAGLVPTDVAGGADRSGHQKEGAVQAVAPQSGKRLGKVIPIPVIQCERD